MAEVGNAGTTDTDFNWISSSDPDRYNEIKWILSGMGLRA
jgi:hypothetical protein